jgi:hypothetical protein
MTDLRLAVSNRPFQTMFGLPEHLVTPGASFEETIRYLVDAGEYGDVDDAGAFVRDRVEAARAFVPHYMERRRANGRTISVEGSPLPGGRLGDGLYRHHRGQAAGGVAARPVRGAERPASRTCRATGPHQPAARGHHRAAGGSQARADRDGGAHPPDDRDDAGPYRPCRPRRGLHLHQPAAGDAAARPRQRHRGPEFRGCARPCGRTPAPDARPRARGGGERSGIHRTELRPPHPHGLHARPDRPGPADQRRLPPVDRRHRRGAGARRPGADAQARTGRAADQRPRP